MTKQASISEGQALILEQIIEAMETDLALPMRVGPKAFGNAMPEYRHTESELFVLEREDISETGGKFTRERHAARRIETERRSKCTKERIGRMDEAFEWIRQSIWDEESRKVLLAYADCKARGWEWARYLSQRNRRNPQKKAWVKRTVQRWIVKSLQLIETNIYKSEIILRGTATLQVAQETAKSSCKSITSGDLRERAMPDGSLSSEAA